MVNISLPSLEKLVIGSADYGCWFKIDTPNLRFFFHKTVSRCHTFVLDLPSLTRGELDGEYNILLFYAMSRARTLILRESFIQQVSRRRLDRLPTFNNLKTVKFHVGSNFDWNMLLKFLKYTTPNLQHLFFSTGLVMARTDGLDFDRFNLNWNWPEFEPECLSSKVETIEVHGFVGFEEEIQFVKYLLKCCKVLNKMVVRSRKPRMENFEWERIESEILDFQRGSSSCEIDITA